jgi:NAD(P)-dependent dehydrogenase (short-subunit alcohol dehydrogenase family)
VRDSEAQSSTRFFDIRGRVAVVTGATGVLGGAMARGLARSGALVGVLGRRGEKAERTVKEIEEAGGKAMALPADVLDREQLEGARQSLLERWHRIDILVNAAGGNVPGATISDYSSVFEMPQEAFRRVLDLNLLGTLLPIQVFGAAMVGLQPAGKREASGCIVNVSSMASSRPLTKVVGYSAAKAAVENLTRWMAVELSRKYGPGIRVNALAPGFFVGEQNRALLLNADGGLTERGRKIIEHTPAGRFGEPEELVGTLIWLCSSAASFVNGAVVPVDGGFGAFSGV